MGKLGTMLQVGRTFGARDGTLRLRYELQRASGAMSRKMRAVQGWDSWNLKRIAPDTSAEELRTARQDGARPFFFTDARGLTPNLRKIVGVDGEESILIQAERILAGHLPFFGNLSFACEFPPRWFQNPVTKQRVSPQQPWTEMRFASPAYGDLKFILEPSRFLWIYPLIRAYALSGDERFPQAFWCALEDWARLSLPMAGPLWICGQECSLRILAWSFALHAFVNSPSTTNRRVALLISIIAAHAWRTAQTFGYARSQRSNHLISEAVGLWTAGTLYPELKDAEVWQRLGARLLHEAVLDQITPEGVLQQHSFNYQRMILHLLLWTLRLAEINRILLHDDIRGRAGAAFDFIRAWVDPLSGVAPNYGSNDGSLIFPLASGSYRDYRPLLQLGAAILDRTALKPGLWDEAALWFGAKPASTEDAVIPSPVSTKTGYFRLGDENSWALVRAGQYTRRPFQSDQLHVDLWWKGINLARDAGTYLYNGAPPWNNGLAGTSTHNTVTVDHQDQMRRASRFLWVDWAQATGRLSSTNHAGADRFDGEHDGYKNLDVKHRRSVQWLDGGGWVIVDDVEGSGVHHVRLHWLAPDRPYEISESPFQIAFTEERSHIRWSIRSNCSGRLDLVRAGKRLLRTNESDFESVADDTTTFGWESATYGDLQPAISMLYQTRSLLPVRITSIVLTDERCSVAEADGQLVVRRVRLDNSQRESAIYRVNLAAKTALTIEREPFPVKVAGA